MRRGVFSPVTPVKDSGERGPKVSQEQRITGQPPIPPLPENKRSKRLFPGGWRGVNDTRSLTLKYYM